jgi:hypothetical protein
MGAATVGDRDLGPVIQLVELTDEGAALVRVIRLALGIVLVLSAALGGCAAQPPGWDPYGSGIGPRVHGSRVLGDQ